MYAPAQPTHAGTASLRIHRAPGARWRAIDDRVIVRDFCPATTVSALLENPRSAADGETSTISLQTACPLESYGRPGVHGGTPYAAGAAAIRSTNMQVRVLSAIIALVLGIVTAAEAQYFGRNKVLYEKFDFKVLATEHFDIYFYPEEEAAVQLAARMAERWYARLSKVLRHELTGRQPLILYAAHPHFQQTNALSGEVGEGTGGVTEMFKRRIVLPFAGGMAETDHVLGHELVHAFQFDMATARDAQGRQVGPAVMMLPLWFIEGMAA